MGNSPGDFKEYLDLTEKYPALCGGFVWEWCDHAIYKGTAENGKAMYWYGGDHGELQHDGNFCLDGLVYPDRTPHTGLMEYKNVHRPLRATYDLEKQVLTLENHLDFTDPAQTVSAAWALTLDGTQIAGGPLCASSLGLGETYYVPSLGSEQKEPEKACAPGLPSIAPHSSAQIPLAFTVPDKGRCFLTITYVLKKETFGLPAGHEIGFDEIRILTREPRALKAAGILAKAAAAGSTAQKPAAVTPKVTEEGRFLCVDGENFTYKLDTLSGLVTSLKIRGRELLDRPIDFNVWRAPTDNDAPIADVWKLERLDHTSTRAYEVTWKETEGAAEFVIRQSAAAMSNQPILRIDNKILVYADGRIRMDIDAVKDPEVETLPRIGLRLFLNGNMRQVNYFGMGPMETYIDKHHAGHHALFKGTVASMQEDYIRPQESGSHYDCDFVTVKGKGLSLTAACADADPDRTFSFNVSAYTQEELEQKRHNYELVPCGSTVLCIDHQMAGIGSKSCGPDLLPKYRLSADTFRFSFMLEPGEM